MNEANLVMRYVCSQFENPRGLIGKLAGNIMANRPSNKERNLWTLKLLDIQMADRVLEVGFGPGFAIKHASRMACQGYVLGIDHSKEMLKMATKRNVNAIEGKIVELRKGSMENLPIREGEKFNKIFSVNTWMFWPDPETFLNKLYGLLLKGGKIAITHQPRIKGATEIDSLSCAEEIASRMQAVGFNAPEIKVNKMEPVAAICVLGEK